MNDSRSNLAKYLLFFIRRVYQRHKEELTEASYSRTDWFFQRFPTYFPIHSTAKINIENRYEYCYARREYRVYRTLITYHRYGKNVLAVFFVLKV